MIDLQNETERLAAFQRYHRLQMKFDKNLQDIVQLAAFIFKAPAAMITLLDKDIQWIIKAHGTPVEMMPRETSFCTHTIQGSEPMIVRNTMRDKRFSNAPLVANAPNIRFYAGVPLTSNTGYNVGTLCVMDVKPKRPTTEQISCLQSLTQQVANFMDLKLSLKMLNDSLSEIEGQNVIFKKIAQVQSHDVRGPLSSVLGLMNVIKYEDYAPSKEYLVLMEGALNKLDEKLKSVVYLASYKNETHHHAIA